MHPHYSPYFVQSYQLIFFICRLYLGYRDYDRYRKYVQKIKNNEVLYTEGSIQLDDSD